MAHCKKKCLTLIYCKCFKLTMPLFLRFLRRFLRAGVAKRVLIIGPIESAVMILPGLTAQSAASVSE